MAGINIIFDRNEYIDHGRYNAQYYNEDPQSSWAYMVRLVEVPMKGLQEDLYVVLEEHDNHTELETMYLANTPEGEKNYIGGGWTGGHIREDGCLSLGTPFKAFSVELAYLASFQYMLKNGAIRLDEAEDDAFGEDDVAERSEYKRCAHRVNQTFGEEVRKGHTAIDV